jgi:hypothetical protein
MKFMINPKLGSLVALLLAFAWPAFAASDVTIRSGLSKGGKFRGTNPKIFIPKKNSAVVGKGAVQGTLNLGRGVTIQSESVATGNGDIIVAVPLAKAKGKNAALALDAARDIQLNAPIESKKNALTIALTADRGVASSAAISTNGGDVLIDTVEPFVVGAAISTGAGTVIQQSGIVQSTSNQTVNAPLVEVGTGASWRLQGTVSGNLSVNGAVWPGAGGTSTLNVGGDLLLPEGSTTEIRLGGTGRGTSHGWINVTGAVAIQGALNVDFASAFEDAIVPNQSFTILTAGSINGTFAGLPHESRLVLPEQLGSMKITYTTTTVVLSDWQPIIVDLVWDPGIEDDGTEVITSTRTRGKRSYFRLIAQDTDIGAWRTRLTPATGEADLYMSRGVLPSTASSQFNSKRQGGDGFVLNNTQFSAGQEWFLLVFADPGHPWTLFSGRAYVEDLGTLQWTDLNSSGTYNIGEPVIPTVREAAVIKPEGMRFYKATVPAGVPAWSLWLGGSNRDIAIRKALVPFHQAATLHDRKQSGQMLVVPGYLESEVSSYYLSVTGQPNDLVTLDSRIQEVIDIPFDAVVSNVEVPTVPYRVYRVQVPLQQIAWDVSTTPLTGDPNIAIRSEMVGAEFENGAFSEVAGAADSITVVPDFLTDGPWFITVYGKSPYSFHLRSGPPEITPLAFTDFKTNDLTQRAGWRYYALTDIPGQLGALGWELQLGKQMPGTEIAIRRNAVPSRWRFREDGKPGIEEGVRVDFSGPRGFLQRPAHQADIWYVGVYVPAQPLGAFELACYPMGPPTIAFEGGSTAFSGVQPGRWSYARVDVPAGPMGWDVRVSDLVSQGAPLTRAPIMVVRRALLAETNTSTFNPSISFAWSNGQQWRGGIDWTGYNSDAAGVLAPPRLVAGMGMPLEPGTYYVGVYNDDAATINFSIESRGIGAGFSYPITNLDYNGGAASIENLRPREARYFKVTVPSNSRGWEVLLQPAQGGSEMMMAVRFGAIPDFSAVESGSVLLGNYSVEMQKVGPERYVLLPVADEFVAPGDYYIAVVSEGQNPAGSVIGAETSGGVLTSGPFFTKHIGTANAAGITESVQLVAGQVKAYQFTVPLNTASLEVRLAGREGDPRMAIIDLPFHPQPPRAYGNDGGIFVPTSTSGAADAIVFTAANPIEGIWTVTVDSPKTLGSEADLIVRALGTVPVAFNGGTESVTEHEAATVRYYFVDVPAGAVGWDIRLRDVAGPMPSMAVARDVLPELPGTSGWSPSSSLSWPSGFRWAAGIDWTGYSSNPPAETGGANQPQPPRLVAGMGMPLEPGRYFIAVFAQSGSTAVNYTVDSRGVGPGMVYPVANLAFDGGSASLSGLAPREARYFRVSIPPNTRAWELILDVAGGSEMEMLVRRGAIPDFGASASGSIYSSSQQVEMQKVNNERFVLLPALNETFIPADDYYVAVVSEGIAPSGSLIGTGTSSGVIESRPLLIKDLGTADADGTTENVVLGAGQIRAYRFSVPPGTDSLEVRLDDRDGHPNIALLRELLPIPANIGVAPRYGNNGGSSAPFHERIITIANPAAGEWNVIVRAGGTGQSLVGAEAKLVITALTTVPLAFDGGNFTVTRQEPATWRYFSVEVPEGARGWDLRLRNVQGPMPAMMVRRDQLPSVATGQPPGSIPGGWAAWSSATWPSGNQWLCGVDWTGYTMNPDSQPVPPRMVKGMGRPLEPGTYMVGVFNNTQQQTTYTVNSRGIGAGFTDPVADLAFQNGTADISDLLPREARYFKVTIPPNTPSWEITLSTDLGEMAMLVRRDTIPDFAARLDGSIHSASAGFEIKAQKGGPERLVLLPAAGQDFLVPADYYIAVVGEGVNPTGNTVGSNPSQGVLTSHGPLMIQDLGAATVVGVAEPVSLKGGQIKAYQLTIPAGLNSLEVRLQTQSGFPFMSMAAGTRLPIPPGYPPLGTSPNSRYGYDGGTGGTQDQSIMTVASPAAGIWTFLVRARHDGLTPTLHPDAAATLVVKIKENIPLNFAESQNAGGGTHTDTRQATNHEFNIYEMTPPAMLDGQPVLGWVIESEVLQGSAAIHVYKNFANPASGITIPIGVAVVVPPYLTFGEKWYVRVRATGLTEYRITSRPVSLERPAWQMPVPHNAEFGDSGTDAQGAPLPGDRGVDLARGFWHFYAIDVPENNAGLLRTELRAISGNPDLYIREDGVPTISHRSNGTGGISLVHRSLTSTTTAYGNWVPLDARTEARLRPGRWYLGVLAGGTSNARYRLIASTGNVRSLAIDAATATAQVPNQVVEDAMADNDWRYYRFTIPENAPLNWQITFTEQVGDVEMRLRDTVPPGQQGVNEAQAIADWGGDRKNQGPYNGAMDLPQGYVFSTPPLRPGHTYYAGFRSKNSATFSLTSSTPGGNIGVLPELNFYTGSLDATIAANSSVVYRIPVPPEGTRFKYTSTHGTAINIRIEQGTLPGLSGTQHFSSSGANSQVNQALSPVAWPWRSGQVYYVRFINNSASPQPLVFTLSGKNAETEDEDNDGLPDAWERFYFGNLLQTAAGDPDNDGVPNAVEFADGTAPNDVNSAKYTLTIQARNGSAGAAPVQAKYDRGTVVSVANMPNPGYSFLAWNGGPFRGDDFALRATGTITIPAGGTWTFGIHAADGARLRVNGAAVIVDGSMHEARDSFGQIALSAGTYPIELVHFERTGGEALELFAAPGSFTAFNGTFRLVGDTANGGLAVESMLDGAPVPEFIVRQVENLAGLVNSLSVADNLLASTTGLRREIMGAIGVLNFSTYNLGEGRFGGDSHFPLMESVQDTPLALAMHGDYTITALNTIPLDEALDAPGLPWRTGGNVPWLGENSVEAFDGQDMAVSGPALDGQNSILQTTVTGPGTLSFRWKVSSQSGDNFAFFIDDAQQAAISGEVDWAQRTHSIGAGVRTLTWQYLKNASGAAGSDRAFLDQVVFTPN